MADTPATDAVVRARSLKEAGARARVRIAQVAEDAYWTPRRQMEQVIADRVVASEQAATAGRRIEELKQQIGA
jgi:hypothetical protein